MCVTHFHSLALTHSSLALTRTRSLCMCDELCVCAVCVCVCVSRVKPVKSTSPSGPTPKPFSEINAHRRRRSVQRLAPQADSSRAPVSHHARGAPRVAWTLERAVKLYTAL